ncbi:EAL domain-containing protein [Rhodobacter capsulatus]|jgi:EAL domain-containing protein (putative c-di-GMP-specific phosphodiesterase class I)/GGDEF domain-containing protein|uniref:Diguanylate cyclase/phosphodiesterase family protein n=1 Tax=Rhodobacter capsulatus (strain ATCC BAA-309 / NBRC 16581 / SB1003) TaxID=272942 RepID=D5AM41_RHOCB|nr:EAL domain-containing protein [Rhodobacter capsulatus]ADE84111.1 diguanylate cyclase/phosphodiesterase family protein [Rhodobacter capsulatus SB 1003]ETD03219.1 diguanylate cyclase [Rhodobacter capsulatus DE442]ETD79488.1 diguanylate cyclase [Rhodobacter capsulatus R121]ETD84363.1 diguanylate cyclase [Rhodobacter capsulatus B6]ETE55278.1 diguanylate cyclase [Rhodobacter capsulatus Y262]
MVKSAWKGKKTGAKRKGPILLRREMVAFLPAVSLAGLWFGLEGMTLVGVTALIVAWMSRPLAIPEEIEEDGSALRALPQRADAEEMMQAAAQDAQAAGKGTACLVIGIDDPAAVSRQMSRAEFEDFQQAVGARIRGVLRNTDRIALIDNARHAAILAPTHRPDLEGMIQLAGRLQQACDAPYSVNGRSVNITSHVGFCLMTRAPEPTGPAILSAAETAAEEAARHGPGCIRAYAPDARPFARTQGKLDSEITPALEDGRIVAYFQPQISTDTGTISGMQAVPRWLDRDRGILGEAEILPAITANGLQGRLAEVMLFQCFGALREWDKLPAGPGLVSLPIGLDHVTDPKMSDRLKWEFDRFDMAPQRVCLVLHREVTARLDDEVVMRNIAHCAKMGCRIELAGFGTGPISVSAIRRTGAERIRIHRSFVTNVERDPEQQRLVSAIISFAAGLGLETLAEGVATIGEHAMLAQLGCHHVQGKAISAPLPLDECAGWMGRHDARLASIPRPDLRRGA